MKSVILYRTLQCRFIDRVGNVEQLKIIIIMSENVKTLVFPEGGTGTQGLDPNLLFAMNGGGGFGNGMNNPFWAIVLLAFLRQWGFGGNGYGNNGNCQLSAIQEQLNTIQGQNSLMSAIQGGTNEVRNLANTLNCDVNAVQAGINSIQQAICNVGNQVGMNAQGIINAVNSGNTAITNQLQNCCCQTQQNILKMGYENQIANLQQSNMLQSNFASLNYNNAEQTCAIKQNATDNANRIIAKIDEVQDAAKNEKIATLTAQLAAANARAERQAELAPIAKALADIQCKQPNTISVPYPQLTALPTVLVNGLGNAGAFGYGLGCGCGLASQSLWS